MTGRERFFNALENKKPDRLPCQVHAWMGYYLKEFLGGADQYAAYDYFSMDPVIYQNPDFEYSDKDMANWEKKTVDLGKKDGYSHFIETITTPKGELTRKLSSSPITTWQTEYWIKDERDFEIWREFVPSPIKVDWSPVIEAKKKIGDRGIVRGGFYDFGQGSPWQTFSTSMYGTQKAIMDCFDKPDWVHYVLNTFLEKKLKVIELGGEFEMDLIETGGGGGSSTVISPALHKEFCLPYDKKQHAAFKNAGVKIVYHLCGGLMPLLEIVAENGADGLETMTPPEMGGDCDLAEASRRVGDKLFFIGGFDQNRGFEQGTPENTAKMVRGLFEKCPDGGYICCPSDHFFTGDPENIRAFVKAAAECAY
ncbi:MAG: hypothetical protein FWF08_05915 [Oscillospiraceae bacterium]|nr:hypothetical protein [Oscillospiraceae bacterium]